LLLESEKMILPPVWKELDKEFERYFTALGPLRGNGSSEVLWLPETVSGKWIQAISSARSKNRAEIETATRELNHQGRLSVQYGLLGMGISTLVGLLGILLISYSIIAPLRILLREIRLLSKDESRNPIPVRSRDEFGELAQAFNEMTDRLEDEERTRSDFISTLSHETRTPLTSIRESVSMIEEGVAGAINDQQRRLLKIAHSEINRICDLLDNLMQVSRLSSGIFELQFRTMDTTAFITQTVLKILPLAKAKNISIEKQLPSQVPNLIGDPDHLPRVFLNLLDNAIKFSSKGDAVKIIVKADQKRGVIEFAIADSGPGVAKSEQYKIFKKYYRGKKVRNYNNGMGLGLSAAKDIVEAHGGVIWVNSKEGAGSTFRFTLPSEGNLA
ncbi:MAG: HAMP domain-containing histidine kinase, partial [Deltaproteobacteria bacterium]|nr:HAMP domain-containing histidine kinase [Deltaproteobacteria bacterium]